MGQEALLAWVDFFFLHLGKSLEFKLRSTETQFTCNDRRGERSDWLPLLQQNSPRNPVWAYSLMGTHPAFHFVQQGLTSVNKLQLVILFGASDARLYSVTHCIALICSYHHDS